MIGDFRVPQRGLLAVDPSTSTLLTPYATRSVRRAPDQKLRRCAPAGIRDRANRGEGVHVGG